MVGQDAARVRLRHRSVLAVVVTAMFGGDSRLLRVTPGGAALLTASVTVRALTLRVSVAS